MNDENTTVSPSKITLHLIYICQKIRQIEGDIYTLLPECKQNFTNFSTFETDTFFAKFLSKTSWDRCHRFWFGASLVQNIKTAKLEL